MNDRQAIAFVAGLGLFVFLLAKSGVGPRLADRVAKLIVADELAEPVTAAALENRAYELMRATIEKARAP